MNKLTFLLSMTLLFIFGCSPKELSPDEAEQMIKQQAQYPRTIDYDIYSSDPQYARKILDAGLEQQGLVTVQQTQKLSEAGQPLIQFTAKAQPYLLATPEKDKLTDIQRVKIAEEDLAEVTAVRTENSGQNAVVEYTTTYKNRTPFSALTAIDFANKATRRAVFSLTDSGWKLEK